MLKRLSRPAALALAALTASPANALPPPASVHKPVAQGQRGPHVGQVGGPAKRPASVGGPAARPARGPH